MSSSGEGVGELLGWVALCAGGAQLGAGVVARHAARWGLLATPQERSSHRQATPQGGGVGMVVVGTCAAWALPWIVPAGSGAQGLITLDWNTLSWLGLLLAGVGLRDDISSLAPRWRLLTQSAVVAGALGLLALSGGQVAGPSPTGGGGSVQAGSGLAGAWLLSGLGEAGPGFQLGVAGLALGFGIWWINLYNFMDGLDGFAASQGLVLALGGGALVLVGHPERASHPLVWMDWALAAACAGFLSQNWPPARIFMGDVGSTWLAFWFWALLMMVLRLGWLTPGAWLALAGWFVVDASWTLGVRWVTGQTLTQAHRTHAYQLLAQRWGGHRPVLLALWATVGLWLGPWAWLLQTHPAWGFQLGGTVMALAPLGVLMIWVRAGHPAVPPAVRLP